MPIPSYDDLTPSIPDVSMRDTFAHVRRILPPDAAPAGRPAPIERDAPPAHLHPTPHGEAPGLFACLRASGSLELRRASENLMAIARDFSPRIERHGAACVVLDVSGLGQLLGNPRAIGAELDRVAADRVAADRVAADRAGAVPAAGIRVAIAPTQIAARLLAIAQPGLTVVTGDVGSALASLPIDALRVLVADGGCAAGGGAGVQAAARMEATTARLDTFRRWGLTTLGEVAALPAADLSERMGQAGRVLQRLASGIDLAPLVPDPGVTRFIQSVDLEWPVDALEPLSFVLARLLDPLSAALERADRGAAALRLDLRLVDRTVHRRLLQLPAAMREAKVLRTLLLLDLESHPPSAAIDVVTLEIDPAPARIVQYSLLERAMPSAEALATLTARLGALVGERRCGSPALLDSYRPDAFEMRRFDPDAPARAVRGFAPAIEAAASGTPILRRFRPPIAVRVTVERGRPVRVAIDRRGMPGGDVEQQAGPWRTSGAWWDPTGAGWDRDEWDVALSDGSLCRLFRDRITERWFLEGVLD
jgi:protein ImuB